MNVIFLVEDSNINSLNSIRVIRERITTSLQVVDINILKEENNVGIYKLTRLDSTNIFVECYRINESNIYLINIINIIEQEKNLFFELIYSDKLFCNSIVLLDSLSNEFITEEFYNFSLLENHIKQYFVLALFQKYGCKTYDIIDNIKTKEDILYLPNNIKTNLQHIQLGSLIDYISDKCLGGLEYEQYSKAYNKENLKILKDLLNENIFDDIVDTLKNNKSLIKDYRNIICHNRILNCNKMRETHCDSIKKVVKRVIALNNNHMKTINKSSNDVYKLDDLEKNIFTFSMKNSKINKPIELILIEILCKINVIYAEKCIEIIDKDTIIYSSEDDKLEININKLHNDEDENLFIVTIKYAKSEKNTNEILINELKDYDIIIIYDSVSIEICNNLAKSFNILENTFREYITLFQYVEKVKVNYKKDKMPDTLAIGITEKLANSIYDLDFIELLHIITAPNGGKNVSELTNKLKKAINDNNNREIEFLLTNMLDYNNDLKVIVKHWCELYRFRTIVAHCGIIQQKDFSNIMNIIGFTRLTVENILTDYLYNNTEIFRYSTSVNLDDIIYIEKSIVEEKFGCCNLRFCKIDESSQSVAKIENIYPFRAIQLLNRVINSSKDNLEQVFSYEYLHEYVNFNRELLLNKVSEEKFQENLSLSLENLGFDQYASFRIVTTEEQKLEEKIGELLNSIHQKMPKYK